MVVDRVNYSCPSTVSNAMQEVLTFWELLSTFTTSADDVLKSFCIEMVLPLAFC